MFFPETHRNNLPLLHQLYHNFIVTDKILLFNQRSKERKKKETRFNATVLFPLFRGREFLINNNNKYIKKYTDQKLASHLYNNNNKTQER